MNILLLTITSDKRVKAGVEVYNEYLKKVFPELKTIGYEDVPRSAFEWFSPLKDVLKALQVCEYVKKNIEILKPDLVITNGMMGWNITEKQVKCPIINVSHGTYAGLASNAIKKTSLEFYRTKFVYAFFEKMSAKNATIVVSNSEFTKEMNKKYYGIGSTVIYNPIDARIFVPVEKEKARQKLGLDIGKKIGLFVGRPEYQKGFDIIEKVAELEPEIDFISITFPKTNGKLRNVKGISAMNREELALYYSAADFVLFPSRFEGFGFVPIEALSCNTPVISSKVGIVREIEAIGLEKVDSFDPANWRQAMQKVLEKKTGIKTSKEIAAKFGFDGFKKKFHELAKELTKN